MARALVDDPEGVDVREISGERETVINLRRAADPGRSSAARGAPRTRSSAILAAAEPPRASSEIVD
jgi:hypothetical protein